MTKKELKIILISTLAIGGFMSLATKNLLFIFWWGFHCIGLILIETSRLKEKCQ